MLSKNLFALRKQKRWSRREFCEKTGIKPGIYQAYEEGRAEPSINTLCLIADFYSITLDQLIREDLFTKIQKEREEEIKELQRLKKKYEGKKK